MPRRAGITAPRPERSTPPRARRWSSARSPGRTRQPARGRSSRDGGLASVMSCAPGGWGPTAHRATGCSRRTKAQTWARIHVSFNFMSEVSHMSNFDQQLHKMKTQQRFHCGAGSKRRQHAQGPDVLRNPEGCVVQRGSDVCDRASDAHAHHHEPQLYRRSDPRRHPVREHDRSGHREAGYRGLSLECETGGALSEGRPGAGSGKGRRPVDETDARACCATRQGQSEAHLRNQDALAHQARQRRGRQGHREPAVRSRSADHRRGPGADRRAGGGYSLPGKSQGRRVAQSGHPREAQRAAGRSAGHAQAHATRRSTTSTPSASVIPRS